LRRSKASPLAAATSPRALLDSVLRFAVQLAERRPSTLDHRAGGNRDSGFEFPQRRITGEAQLDLAQAGGPALMHWPRSRPGLSPPTGDARRRSHAHDP
jgi:hypothetical protein